VYGFLSCISIGNQWDAQMDSDCSWLFLFFNMPNSILEKKTSKDRREVKAIVDVLRKLNILVNIIPIWKGLINFEVS
jgi:hypothetical protein